MGLDNPLHIVFLLVIVLLVFGAKRLPEMGRSLGAGLRGFKESIAGEETPEHAAVPLRMDAESASEHAALPGQMEHENPSTPAPGRLPTRVS